MATLVERSYISLLLEKDPDFYANARDTARVEYRFSNDREFLGHELYNWGPFAYEVIYNDQEVWENGEKVLYYSDTLIVDNISDDIDIDGLIIDDNGYLVIDDNGFYCVTD